MKVLITTDWYAPVVNGVVTSVLLLQRELEARGHEVRVVTLSNSLHTYKDGPVYYMGSVSANRIYPGARLRVNRTRSMLHELIAWRPDVILLDLILPVMSGVELLRQYRREGGGAKVLVMTGADLGKVQGLVCSLGANMLLSKPVRWGEVIGLCRLLAGGLEEQCRLLLREMGGREKGRGFEQAVQCAALLGENRCALLKEAYIEVARRQRTTVGSISKNIERLAKEVHQKGTPRYRRLTGREGGDPPLSNREFLDILSQAARIPL